MNVKEYFYYEYLYCVNLDGSGLKLLIKGDYFYCVEVDDDVCFVVDNYLCVNMVFCVILLDINGNKVMDIQESDFLQFFVVGYKFLEIFKVKVVDGVIDLYGVMYKFFNFDLIKVYFIVDYVYFGLQVEGVYYLFICMSFRIDCLVQVGFIVIFVG